MLLLHSVAVLANDDVQARVKDTKVGYKQHNNRAAQKTGIRVHTHRHTDTHTHTGTDRQTHTHTHRHRQTHTHVLAVRE